jgi:protease-4
MSEAREPQPQSPAPTPPPIMPPRYPPMLPPRRSTAGTLLGICLGLSLAMNFICLGGICLSFIFASRLAGSLGGATEQTPITERHFSGDKSASDKIAILHVDGVLMEGLLKFVHKEIAQAAKDKEVKAVVLRINSPGGTITASDDLYHRLVKLRDGKGEGSAKPLVVSMGSMAASGGYYISMPGQVLYAERTSITGSIGVYASFPNIKELGDKIGFHMNLVKAGRVKDSGSPFQEMKPEERYLWQQMVNHAYDGFKEVVETGRPALKGKLEDKVIDKDVQVTDIVRVQDNGKEVDKSQEKTVHYIRQRADGGIWTADKAKEYGLIDKIGYLEDAVAEAAQLAGLTQYNAVSYEKPISLSDLLFGMEAPEEKAKLDPSRLSSAMTPRLWYMAPQSELAGILTTVGR